MLPLTAYSPMLLLDRKQPFSDPCWRFELKSDGYRLLASVDAGRVELRTRNGADATAWYPEVAAGLANLAGSHVLDGEVCVLDDLGRPDFDRLHDRARRRRWVPGCDPAAYLAFDLLVHRGGDIRGLPVEQRKAALLQLLTPAPPGLLYVQQVDGTMGELLDEQACALQLEGVVAKRLGSPYASGGRNANWLKIKRPGAVPPERFKRGTGSGQGAHCTTTGATSRSLPAHGPMWRSIGR